ncbi:MAG: hypothetical protein WCK27_08425 [Verrucomicrobiota bacterium]
MIEQVANSVKERSDVNHKNEVAIFFPRPVSQLGKPLPTDIPPAAMPTMMPPLVIALCVKQNAVNQGFCGRPIGKEAVYFELFRRLQKPLLKAHSFELLSNRVKKIRVRP